MNGTWREYFAYSHPPVTVPASTAGDTFTPQTVDVNSDADFYECKRNHVVTSQALNVFIVDDSRGRQLQNRSVPILGISSSLLASPADTIFLPHILVNPYLFKAGTHYTVNYADLSGVANVAQMVAHGYKVRRGRAPWDQLWRDRYEFSYVGRFTTDSAGRGEVVIETKIDSHFIVNKLSVTSDNGIPVAAGLAGDGALRVQIRDGVRDKTWSNIPLLVNNHCGSGKWPLILPAPRFVFRGSNVVITGTNGPASNTYEFVLTGEKLYGDDPDVMAE